MTVNQSKKQDKQYQIPMVVTDNVIRDFGFKPEDVTWRRIGNRKYRIVMVDATEEEYRAYMAPIWAEIKREDRDGRYVVKGKNGNLIRCPEINRCEECKHFSEASRERNKPASLSVLMDEGAEPAAEAVQEVKQLLNCQLQELASLLYTRTDFYASSGNSHDEAYARVMFLKKVIEDMDGYRIFYINGKPLRRENDLQIMYRLIWYATEFDVNREVNNGRGPVDFKVSKGARDATLVEFKLASNAKLKKNLSNQVEIYKAANRTDRAIKVILYFTEGEYAKVNGVLNDLGLHRCPDIVLIDATDNKPSASNAG